MMHRIFVPFDGSPCSLRALKHAADLARLMGDGTLHLAYAHEPPVIYGEIAVYVHREQLEAAQRARGEEILKGADAALKAAGVPYEKEVLIGPVAQVLAERAAVLGCDTIVMGTHGMTALGNLVMGSIAIKVVHLTRLPVTLVK